MNVTTEVHRDLERLARLLDGARSEVRRLCGSGTAAPSADLDALSRWLYGAWYSTPAEALAPDSSALHRQDLASVLRAALPGARRWSAGWVVLDVGQHGACVAGRRGSSRVVRPGEYVSVSRPGVPVAPGDALAVADAIEWVDWPTGFWTTVSAVGAPSGPMTRLYLSVDVRHVARVLARLVDCLESLAVAYSIKCPVWPAGYGRVDTMVVYLERAAWDGAGEAVQLVARDLAAWLRPCRPPLTLPLARGVACAEDPGTGESFGQCRCRMLAAPARAFVDRPRASSADETRFFLLALSAAGVDPEHPWLAGKG